MFPEPSRQVSICEPGSDVVQKVCLPEASPCAALSSGDQESLYVVSFDWGLGAVARGFLSLGGRVPDVGDNRYQRPPRSPSADLAHG